MFPAPDRPLEKVATRNIFWVICDNFLLIFLVTGNCDRKFRYCSRIYVRNWFTLLNEQNPLLDFEGTRFINSIEPRYTIPSWKHFTETVFLKIYDVAKSNLQSEINQIGNIAITRDMWTSANTESYGTTICHYITD